MHDKKEFVGLQRQGLATKVLYRFERPSTLNSQPSLNCARSWLRSARVEAIQQGGHAQLEVALQLFQRVRLAFDPTDIGQFVASP